MKAFDYKINFGNVKYFSEIHEVLKRDLKFPDYYGGTTDALWDCLTDMLGSISHIEVYGFENIEKRFYDESREILAIFRQTKHAYADKYSNRFFVTLIHEDGTREEIT